MLYAFLTTMLSEASILVNISSFTLRELSFPLDMLTKLIVYCSQHVRTAGFASDCKMFGKPHAFSEGGSIPSVPASAAVFAYAQNAGSCPQWERAEENVSSRLTKQHWFSCNHGQILPGSHLYSLPKPTGKPTDNSEPGRVFWRRSSCCSPYPGEITALSGSSIAHGWIITGEETMHHPFWKRK